MKITAELILLILLSVVIVFLQVFLSKRDSRLPGLVLPIATLLYSFVYPFNIKVPSEGVTLGFVSQILIVLLLANIPTIILLAIYFGCKEKIHRNKQINKMNIQDLE